MALSRLARRLLTLIAFLLIALLLTPTAFASGLADDDAIPDVLKPWVGWVTHDAPRHGCTWLENNLTCDWPGRLDVSAQASGAEFTMEVWLDKKGWVTLPGGPGIWPQDVLVGGMGGLGGMAGATVNGGVFGESEPRMELGRGRHVIIGRLVWKQMPEIIPVSPQMGTITLQVNDESVAHPRLDREGRLWLKEGGPGTVTEADSLRVSIYRRIEDGVPLRVTTLLELNVAGRAREVELGQLLIADSRPVSAQGDLPIQVGQDGDVTVYMRPGTHYVEITAVIDDHNKRKLTVPSSELSYFDPQEVWIWQPNERLRSVDLSGLTAIDAERTSLPSLRQARGTQWSGRTTFLAASGQSLNFNERRRGLTETAPNTLHLAREIWFDLDGQGATSRDNVSGTMHRGWRLNYGTEATVGRIAQNGSNLLITADASEEGEPLRGVELRESNLQIEAEVRLDQRPGRFQVVGWDHDMQSLSATLHMPPGWSLLGGRGVDKIHGTWMGSWTLLDFFFVLLVALSFGRLLGWRWGLVALGALCLGHDQPEAPRWVWVHLLISLALLRVITRGHIRRLIVVYRGIALVFLFTLLATFVHGQIQEASHPQTASTFTPHYSSSPDRFARIMLETEALTAREELAPPADIRYDSDKDGRYARQESTQSYVAKKAKLQQIDPNAVVQTGPGLPTWNWQSWRLEWSGPVHKDHTISLWFISPTQNAGIIVVRLILFVLLALMIIGRREMFWSDPDPTDGDLDTGSGSPEPPAGPAPDAAASAGSATPAAASAGSATPAAASAAETATSKPEASPASPSTEARDPEPEPEAAEAPEPAPEAEKSASPSTDAPSPPPSDESGDVLPGGAASTTVLLLAAMAAALMSTLAFGPSVAFADEIPPPEMLQELKQRVVANAHCDGPCTVISHADITVDDLNFVMRARVSAQKVSGLILPGPDDPLRITQVLVNGRPTSDLRRSSRGLLSVRLMPGASTVEVRAQLVNRDVATIQFDDASRPRSATFQSPGWSIDGLDSRGVPDSSIQLTRQVDAVRAEDFQASRDLPPWHHVTRTFAIGLPWQVRTTITREQSERPHLLRLPMLAGEAVITEGLRVEDGHVLVDFGRDVSTVEFVSELPVTPEILLTAPTQKSWTETWRLECSRIWRCEAHPTLPSGPVSRATLSAELAPVSTVFENTYLPEWQPWPGEGLRIEITRPEGTPGQAITVESVDYVVTPGKRLLSATLSLNIRASQGGWQTITLPPGAELQSVTRNGSLSTVRPTDGEVRLPVEPGFQSYYLSWQQPWERAFHEQMPPVVIGSEFVNAKLQMNLGPDRWLLWTTGPSWGPAILFWSHLIMLLLVAGLLGLWKLSPLRTWEWLLLMIGLAQLPVLAILPIVAWFIVLSWRAQYPLEGKLKFNFTQFAIVGLTLVAMGCLYAAIHTNLLFAVDMQVEGANSTNTQLRWYVDRAEATLPGAGIYSLPLWIWRSLMLFWALLMAWKMLQWLPWAWKSFSHQQLWKRLRNH